MLHHLAVQLNSRRAREREREQLRDRQDRLTDLLAVFTRPDSTEAVGRPLANFLYEEFGKRPGTKAKATVRRFERGSGNLIRIGGPVGTLVPTQPLEKININNLKSTYARVSRSMTPILLSNIEPNESDIIYTNLDVKSSLTLPLSYQGACFGAANLESDRSNAFTLDDQSLAGSIVEAAAAAIARHRSLRLLEEATELLGAIADAPTGADARTLLELSANFLYRFCGYSDLIIAMPPATDSVAWDVVEVYRADPAQDIISPADDDLLKKWRNTMRSHWTETHLYHLLTQVADFGFTNKPNEYYSDEALRPGRPTLSQATLKVTAPGASKPEALLALLFEHLHPLSDRQEDRLKSLGQVMGRIFLAQGRTKTLMNKLAIQSQEATLGRLHSTYQHHFKRGLNTMTGMIDTVKFGDARPEQILEQIRSYIQKLDPLVRRDRNLVKDLKIEMIRIGDLWDNIIDETAAEATQASVVVARAPIDLPALQGDRELLREILFILIDNTFRYAGPGARVTIRGSTASSVVVADNGKGLHPFIKARLFEINNTTAGVSTGLGLYLAQHWAKMMGGELIYLSQESGTAFEIQLKKGST